MGRSVPRSPAGTRRPLLTFRLDSQRRQRLRARLAVDGRTMSEVIILGLQLYVQHGLVAPETTEHSTAIGSGTQPQAVPDGDAAERIAAKAALLTAPAGAAWDMAQDDTDRNAAPRGTAVASLAELQLPDYLAAVLRDLRESGRSDLLSVTLAELHEVGWPLRPLAEALGISRQAVQARIRQPVSAELRSQLPDCPPPRPFPRRRAARAGGRRPHLTIKIDHALRTAAHRRADREGNSLSQVVERILDHYLRHGLPAGGVELGDTTPTRPARRRRKR